MEEGNDNGVSIFEASRVNGAVNKENEELSNVNPELPKTSAKIGVNSLLGQGIVDINCENTES